MKNIYELDGSGYWTHGVKQIDDGAQIPSGFTDVEPWTTNSNGTRMAYQSAKFVNGSWTEGATAEELAALNKPATPTPTLEQQQIAQLFLITAQLTTKQAQGATTNG